MTAALHTLSLSELGSLLRSREISPVDVVQFSLDRMESTEPELQAFISRTGDSALAEVSMSRPGTRTGRKCRRRAEPA